MGWKYPVRLAQQKARRGIPARATGADWVNTLFWKILVTRVNTVARFFGPNLQHAH
jgi:hypothetical protein